MKFWEFHPKTTTNMSSYDNLFQALVSSLSFQPLSAFGQALSSLRSVQHSNGLWVVLLHLYEWPKKNSVYLPFQASCLEMEYRFVGVFVTVSVINWQLHPCRLCQDLKVTGLVPLESVSEYNHAKSTCLSLGIAVQSSDICLGSLDSYCGQNNWQPTF